MSAVGSTNASPSSLPSAGVHQTRRLTAAVPLILLSFDAEEFDLPLELGQQIDAATQLAVGREGMVRTLDLLARVAAATGKPISTTFFCTVVFAEANADLIRLAVHHGHEIASHGVRHTGWTDADLATSRRELSRISGIEVIGFRRARLAETDRSLIEQAGYRYNSSENPTWIPGRYNRFFKPRLPYRTGRLLNIPASVTPLIRMPLFWLSFKVLPLWATRLASRSVLARDLALVLYFHPWELCELQSFRVPRSVRSCDGTAMIRKLEAHLVWLSTKGQFATYAELSRRIVAARPA